MLNSGYINNFLKTKEKKPKKESTQNKTKQCGKQKPGFKKGKAV